MSDMGRHTNGTGLRGEDGAAATATLEPAAITTAFEPRRIGPLTPWGPPSRDTRDVTELTPPAYGHETITEELIDAARGIDGDAVIRVLTAVVVLAVAAFAAVVSYSHIFELGRLHGQDGTAARLLPLSVDGLIAAASLVMLHSARNSIHLRLVSWPRAMLVFGVAATIAANVFYGLPFGWLAAVISAWPAIAFIGSVEMAMRLVRDARQAAASGEADAPADAAPGPAADAGKPAPPDVPESPPEAPSSPPRSSVTPKPRKAATAPSLRAQATAMMKANPGITNAEVAKRTGASDSTIDRARSDLAKVSS